MQNPEIDSAWPARKIASQSTDTVSPAYWEMADHAEPILIPHGLHGKIAFILNHL